jgi:starch phosphorylase
LGRLFFVCAGSWLRGWIKRMKRTIRTLGWPFNADRMVIDYTVKC